MAHLFQVPLDGFGGPEKCISGGPVPASRLVALEWPGVDESVVFASGRCLYHVSHLGLAAPRDTADQDVLAPSNRGSAISAPMLRESHPTKTLPSLPSIRSELQCVVSRSLPNGSTLVAASDAQSNAHLWRIVGDAPSSTAESWLRSSRLESSWTSVALAEDGSRCALVHGLEQDLTILQDGDEAWSCATKGSPACVAFLDESRLLLTEGQRLTLVDTRLPARRCRVRSDAIRCPPGATLVSMDVVGDQVAVVGTNGPVTLWDAARWRFDGDWAAPVKHESVCVRMDRARDRCFVAGSGSELVAGRRSTCCSRRGGVQMERSPTAGPAAKRSRTDRGAVPGLGAGGGRRQADGTAPAKSSEKPTRSRLDMKHMVGFRGDSRWVGMATAGEGADGSLFALSSFGNLFVVRHSQRMVPE